MSQADYIGVALQAGADLKLAASAPAFFPPVTAESIGMDRQELDITETLGSRAPAAREYGGRLYSGDIEFAARPISLPIILAMFMGTPASAVAGQVFPATTALVVGDLVDTGSTTVVVTVAGTTAASAPTWGTATAGTTVASGSVTFMHTGVRLYKHTFNPVGVGKAPHPATVWTINADPATDIVDKFIGVKGNQLEMNIEANDYLQCTAGVLAYDLVGGGAAPSASRDASKKWAFHQVGAKMSIAGGGLASIPLLSFGNTFNNNLVDDQYVLGSKLVDSIPEGNIETETTFVPGSDLEDHYRRALLDSPQDVRLLLQAAGVPYIPSSAPVAAQAAAASRLEIDLKRLQYTEAPVDIDAGETLRSVEVTAMPVLDESTGGLQEISVYNTDAGTNYTA